MKSTVSPSAMLQVAPSSLQQHQPVNHSASPAPEDIKPTPSTLAMNHSTLHAMLSPGGSGSLAGGVAALAGGAPNPAHLGPSHVTMPGAIPPGGYSTHNPDVLAGLTTGPAYGGMTHYTSLPLSAPAPPTSSIYNFSQAGITSSPAPHMQQQPEEGGASTSPNPAQMTMRTFPAALPGISPGTDAAMLSMSTLSSSTSVHSPLISAYPQGGAASQVMYSLTPSPPKAVPVMMDGSSAGAYLTTPEADRHSPAGSEHAQVKPEAPEIATLTPAQVPAQ